MKFFRLLPFVFALAASAHAAAPVRPNIVVILADDLGAVDINAYAARLTGAKRRRVHTAAKRRRVQFVHAPDERQRPAVLP